MELIKKHILVVDDEPVLRNLYEALLENYGYTSETAMHGGEAVTKLALNSYDAVLLDYMMPGITGLMVLQHIQQQYPSLPVVMITGHTDEQIAAQALIAGARACLYKPFNCMELKEVMECLVGTPSVRAVVSEARWYEVSWQPISHQEDVWRPNEEYRSLQRPFSHKSATAKRI
ncbi:MAG: response regulator [Nitrospirota bacterium]